MALFNTDLEALIFISIITLILITVNKLLSLLIQKVKRFSSEQKVKLTFIIRISSIIAIVYIVIEGFPSFTQIDPTYSAIITGSISTALAFATSEIFASIMAGLLMFIIDPFDIGHVIKINKTKGIVRSISLTKVTIETFDNVIVEIFNSDIVSSKIVNYTIDLSKIKRYYQFKNKILSPQDKGKARLNLDFDDTYRDNTEQIRAFYETVKKSEDPMIHNYTFRMAVPYKNFRIKIDKIRILSQKYSDIFGFPPQFHIVGFNYEIFVKFRILTLDSKKLLDFQPKYAKDIFKIINMKTSD